MKSLFNSLGRTTARLVQNKTARLASCAAIGGTVATLTAPLIYVAASSSPSSSSALSQQTTHSQSSSAAAEEPPHHTQRKVVAEERSERRWSQLRVFSGTANRELAEEVAEYLHTNLSGCDISRFADGEIGIRVLENVRGKDVFLIQPTCPPGVNDNLLELILMISTMRRASARSITAVLPYYGYARQDRKMQSRVPISAADVARLLEAMGVDRVVAVDLHCGQIQGFFSPRTPCDNLDGSVIALQYFRGLNLDHDKTVVVSPDAGGVYRAKRFRDGLKSMGMDPGLAMIVKQRQKAGEIQQMDLVGSVEGCDCIIVDDMIDTAGTLCKAGAQLKARGAKRIFAFATHGLFSGPALERIDQSDFEKVVVCNTIPLPKDKTSGRIEQLSIASLISKAIYSIHFKTSISKIFALENGEFLPTKKTIPSPSNGNGNGNKST